jgi:hypothetical protein
MSIQLTQPDFEHLVTLLSQHSDWLSTQARVDLMRDVFAGSPRRATILGGLNLDGAPRLAAVRVIDELASFGMDEPGRESLGVLVNKLIAYKGDGAEVDFLRDLLHRYPFATRPIASRRVLA